MSSRDQGMGRREFLTTSAFALATAAAAPNVFAAMAGQPRVIVAGFAPLEIESAGTEVFHRNVIAAERIPASDAVFGARGASVSMYGMSGGNPRTRRALDFRTHFAYRDGGEERLAPYHVWAGSSSPVRFTVPVDHDRSIRFSVTAPMPVAKAAGAPMKRRFALSQVSTETAPTALPIALSLGGGVKLARGFYVVVPRYDGDATPNWSAYSLRKDGNRWTLHTSDGRPVSFEHFVVRIDYATPRQARVLQA